MGLLETIMAQREQQERERKGMRPEVGIALMGLGQGLGQLGAGQPVNMSAALQMVDSLPNRPGGLDEIMNDPVKKAAFMDLSRRYPQLAERLLAKTMLGVDLPQQERTKGVEVGGRLVDPYTGSVIYQGEANPYAGMTGEQLGLQGEQAAYFDRLPPEMKKDAIDQLNSQRFKSDDGFRQASPEEATQYGASAGQFGPDGRFYPINPPSGTSLTMGPNGEIQFSQGSGVKPMTESRSKYMLFSEQMAGASPAIDAFESQFDVSSVGERALSTPMANVLQSGVGQRYDTAAAVWSEGALRLATGAAATQDEINRVRSTYFAEAGDKPETLAFKREMRMLYEKALRAAMGENTAPPDPARFASEVAGTEQSALPPPLTPEQILQMTPEQLIEYYRGN